MKNYILNFTLFLILFCLLISCTDQTECIVIFDKYEGNGNFYFEWDRSNGLNSSNFQLGTGAVSEEIYNQYDIGDTYCIEELML